jgi:histidinol-phosphate/aromatic aminotransferase/cobyric acid decarboxylase-like protein
LNKTIYKENILNLKRVQTSVNRNLFDGLNLDRNERVDLFSKKIQKEIKSKLSEHIFNATPDISSLYKNLANYLKINVFNLYLTQGITEAIFQILFSYTKKNDEVIILDETYPMYKIFCQLRDVNYKTWSFKKNLELDLNDLKKIITKRTKIIFLVNPNLPIEYEFNYRFKNEIYKICVKKKILDRKSVV